MIQIDARFLQRPNLAPKLLDHRLQQSTVILPASHIRILEPLFCLSTGEISINTGYPKFYPKLWNALFFRCYRCYCYCSCDLLPVTGLQQMTIVTWSLAGEGK